MNGNSFLITVRPDSNVVGKFAARLSVDVQSAPAAPVNKSIGIEIRLYDNITFTPEVIKAVLSLIEPILESAG